MREYYLEPLLAPFDRFADPLRFHNGRLGFEAIRVHIRGSEPEIHSAFDFDENELQPFLERPKNTFATDFAVTMGIVNVTPDSFSDGGAYFERNDALAHAQSLVEQGASLLDFGAESTRPGAEEVSVGEEIERLEPLFSSFTNFRAAISVDTRKAEVAEMAIEAGAHMINDVSALNYDPEMAAILANSEVALCLMHAKGDPKTMQDQPKYTDVVLEVFDYLEERVAFAESCGIARERVIVDPGIGFGKSLEHNLSILRHLSVFHGLHCPILLGASRKSMIDKIHTSQASDRLGGSLAIALDAAHKGAQILRVHDVFETVQALRVQDAIEMSGA